MRFHLRTLLIGLAAGPPVLAATLVTAGKDPARAIAGSVLLAVVLRFIWRVVFGPREPWKSA